jgi:hypothetical protein
MPKLTQADVFKMFEPLGITSERVVEVLDSCADNGEAFRAFEGLKSLATIRYEEMRGGEVSAQRFQEVKPVFERLMRISLKNYTPKKKKPPTEEEDKEKMRNSKVVLQMAKISKMLKKGDAAGLMKLLDPDADSAEEKEAVEAFLRKFQKSMDKK